MNIRRTIANYVLRLYAKEQFDACMVDLGATMRVVGNVHDVLANHHDVSRDSIEANHASIRQEFFDAATNGESICQWIKTYKAQGNGRVIAVLLFYYYVHLRQLSQRSIIKLLELYEIHHST